MEPKKSQETVYFYGKEENSKCQIKVQHYEKQMDQAWSEWSDCSKTCGGIGIQKRKNKCSDDEETRSCNNDVPCPKSGKFTL